MKKISKTQATISFKRMIRKLVRDYGYIHAKNKIESILLDEKLDLNTRLHLMQVWNENFYPKFIK